VQAILRDKAIAERERVTAEIQTMTMRRDLAEKEGEAQAVRIEKIGEVLRRYPEFLQYDLQTRMPDIYREAGEKGNLVIAALNPSVVVSPLRTEASGAAQTVSKQPVAVPAPLQQQQ
jgi:hypothetical protein